MKNDFDVSEDEIKKVEEKARQRRKDSGRVVVPVTEDSHFAYVEDQINQAFEKSSGEDPEEVYRETKDAVSDIRCSPEHLSRYFRRRYWLGGKSALGVQFSALLDSKLKPGQEIVLDATPSKQSFDADISSGILSEKECGYELLYDTDWNGAREYGRPSNVCSFLRNSTVIVKGNVGDGCAQHLKKGAKVIFEGEVGNWSGGHLEGGTIEFKGPVPLLILHRMKDGHAVVYRFKDSLYSTYACDGFQNTFGGWQEGGKIEVFCDFPSLSEEGLAAHQSGGETIFHKDVSHTLIGYGKSGGLVDVRGRVLNSQVGTGMKGGDIVIGSASERALVGFGQQGGTTRVRGNVEGLVEYDCRNCQIIVDGDVVGDVVSSQGSYGTKIIVRGSVRGDVAKHHHQGHFTCEIGGDLRGNILGVGPFHSTDSDPKSELRVDGHVYGTVGGIRRAVVYVRSGIDTIGACREGSKIYVNGEDVTPTTAGLIARGIFKSLFG